MKNSERGFTLIQLLVIVFVLVVIAYLAWSPFSRPRRLASLAANEQSAIVSLKAISAAEMDYSTNSGSGFSPTLTTLAQMIGSDLASGQKNGYNFTYKVGEQYKGQYVSYTLNADPAIPGSTGLRHFYMDASGVLRVNDSTSAGPSDPELK